MARWLTVGIMLGGTGFLFLLVLLLPPAGLSDSVEGTSADRIRPAADGFAGPRSLLGAWDELPAPLPDFGPNAIAGEAVVYLGSLYDAQTLRELAAQYGLDVVAVIEELGFARLRGDRESLARFMNSGHELEGNFRVNLPPRADEEEPPARFAGDLVGFESGVLRFLGVPSDNDSWGEGVLIAVLDTGVDAHPAIDSSRVRSLDLIDPSRGGVDDNGHGTAVVYHLIARDEFDTGIVPAAEVLSVRVLDHDGVGDSFTLALGIITAVNEGANVVNLSLGTRSDSSVLQAAIDYAGSRNVTVIAAAGNDGVEGVAFPAAYASVLSVGAVDARERWAPFSNYGGVDVVAPGYGLPSGWLDGEYVSLGGTSAAAPLVTGAVARLVSQDPQMSPATVQRILKASSNDLGVPGPDPFHGVGRIDLERMEWRNSPGIYDLAVTDFALVSEVHGPDQVILTAGFQNRGTEPVANARARLYVGDVLVAEERVDLAVGEVHGLRTLVHLEQLRQERGLDLRAEIFPPDAIEDWRPGDNIRRESASLSRPRE